ncbi:MAG: YdcF family protein [Proteobacteria bacterium]|nr:YdcF family protein [Pseudomonadota bacterium]
METPEKYQSIVMLRVTQVVIAAGIFWLAGFGWFLATLPESGQSDEGLSVDGIVVLTGSPGRVQAGLDYLAWGKGRRLLISGVNRELARETILNAFGGAALEQACCIDLGRNARDTHGNAIEAAEWAGQHGFRSLLIVTADYHLPRALLELGREMENVTLFVLAVDSHAPVLSMASEFNKYLFSIARDYVGPADTRD